MVIGHSGFKECARQSRLASFGRFAQRTAAPISRLALQLTGISVTEPDSPKWRNGQPEYGLLWPDFSETLVTISSPFYVDFAVYTLVSTNMRRWCPDFGGTVLMEGWEARGANWSAIRRTPMAIDGVGQLFDGLRMLKYRLKMIAVLLRHSQARMRVGYLLSSKYRASAFRLSFHRGSLSHEGEAL